MEYTASEYQSPYGFRLQPSREREPCGSSESVASYKQRIDSMFDDTHSVATERGKQRKCLRSQSTDNGEDMRKLIENDNKLLAKNMVQARIEKMFAEVEGDGEGKVSRSRVDSSMFYVDYLGSLPLMKKVSSLEGLQEPLKDLYLNHKQGGNIDPTFQDVLEISNCGLRVKYLDEKQDEVVEQLNPFPTIAVWAAVKLVCRPRGLDHGKEFGLEYAFMPLISDPEHIEKMTLFRKLTPNEACYFTGDYYSDHSPLFVAVMRKLGVSRQLECHGFACDSNESAIVIAANLYKALVITMAKNPTSEDNCRTKNLKQKNGLNTVCSVGGSSLAGDVEFLNSVKDDSPPILPPVNKKNESKLPITDNILNVNSPKKVPPPRPPRKEKSFPVRKLRDTVILHVNHPDPDEILQLPNPSSQSPHFLKSNSFNFTNGNKNEAEKLVKSHLDDFSERFGNKVAIGDTNKKQSFGGKRSSFRNKDFSDGGDILTKIAIPRSHSFLNANGPLSSRYNRHASSGSFIGNSIKRKNSLGSPLGLNELFNEFRMQEGLNNLEDILSAIIDPDGMSFNDLKPIYKEFLLKLAVTLTKDEMYQRSKTIMQRQKRRKKKATIKNSSKLKISFSAGGGLKRVFRRSLLKLKQKRTKPNGFEFSSVLFPSCTRFREKKCNKKSSSYLKGYRFPYNSSSDESSLVPQNLTNSCEIKIRTPLREIDLPDCSKINPSQVRENKKASSEFRDFFSSKICEKSEKPLIQNKAKVQPSENCIHHASSGYFSCSDCSYDSESCTYTSADKCYCSRKNPGQSHLSVEDQDKNNMSLTSCECDTDSCFESEKCYCNQRRKPSLFEQLKQQGFVASESSLSRANSPTTSWKKNDAEIKNGKGKTCKQIKEDLQMSKSLQFLKIRQRHNSMSQLPLESKYHKSSDIYQSPVDDFESEFRSKCLQKSSLSSSSPVTSSFGSKSNNSLSSQQRSISSDNLALDYNMFSKNGKNEDQDVNSQQKKVLVVSTRDPKGRVIYVSAAQRCTSPIQIFNTKRDNTDALSVKKSAEIAALFSDVKLTSKAGSSVGSIKDEVIYNTLEPPEYFFSRAGSNYSKKTSLESSLGYFP